MRPLKVLAVAASMLVLGVPAARGTDLPVTIVDTLNAPSNTTFNLGYGGGGISIDAEQHVGPTFTLAMPTTITEIGSFLTNCSGVYCDSSQLPLTVEIRRAAVGGVPDPNAVVASFPLSDDGDPNLVSYESAKPNLLLQPGSYAALFAPQRPEDRGGFALTTACFADRSCTYHPASTSVGTVTPGINASVGVAPFPARILGIAHVPPAKLAAAVGPGARIVFPHSAKAGETIITVRDRTKKDNLHLTGPGVNKKTGVRFTGKASWTVTLKAGTYVFRSDAHPAHKGRMSVG